MPRTGLAGRVVVMAPTACPCVAGWAQKASAAAARTTQQGWSLPVRLLGMSCCCAQVSRVAKAMITQLGFSAKLGQVAWSGGQGPTNLGQSMGQGPDCSAQTTNEIDNEVKALVERAYRCVLQPLHSCHAGPLGFRAKGLGQCAN